MGKKFDEQFDYPCQFYSKSWHVSRKRYSREEAANLFAKETGRTVDPEQLNGSWVRFQFSPEELCHDVGSHCWVVIEKKSHGAMPTWEYNDK